MKKICNNTDHILFVSAGLFHFSNIIFCLIQSLSNIFNIGVETVYLCYKGNTIKNCLWFILIDTRIALQFEHFIFN